MGQRIPKTELPQVIAVHHAGEVIGVIGTFDTEEEAQWWAERYVTPLFFKIMPLQFPTIETAKLWHGDGNGDGENNKEDGNGSDSSSVEH